MAFDDGYERVEIEEDLITDAQRIIVEGFIRDGEFKAREELISMLSKDVDEYLEEVDHEPNVDWVNGVRYAIHIIREAKLDGPRG